MNFLLSHNQPLCVHQCLSDLNKVPSQISSSEIHSTNTICLFLETVQNKIKYRTLHNVNHYALWCLHLEAAEVTTDLKRFWAKLHKYALWEFYVFLLFVDILWAYIMNLVWLYDIISLHMSTNNFLKNILVKKIIIMLFTSRSSRGDSWVECRRCRRHEWSRGSHILLETKK